MFRVAVQIPLYKSSAYLSVLLESLKAQIFQDWKLYVIENTCDAMEVERVKALFATHGVEADMIVSDVNTGFAGGHNILFARHEAEYIFTMNDDAYVEPDFLAACVRRLDQDPACGSVEPLVYRWTASPSEQEVLSDATFIDTAGLSYRALAHVGDLYASETRGSVKDHISTARPIMGASGAMAVYRRSACLAVSPDATLYDPDFFMYKEDVDLAIRLRRGGFSCWFEPAAVAFHRRSIKMVKTSLLGRLREERLRHPDLRRMMYLNQWRLYIYHVSWTLGARDLVYSFLFESVRGLLVCIASPKVFCLAWWDIIRTVPASIRRRRFLRQIGLTHRLIMTT